MKVIIFALNAHKIIQNLASFLKFKIVSLKLLVLLVNNVIYEA